MRHYLVGLISFLSLLGLVQSGLAAETQEAVDIQVFGDASAKIGQPASIGIKITPKPGYQITRSYRNRVIELSGVEPGLVEFDPGPVRGAVAADNTLVFDVNVTPIKPGKHPINGIIRFSFHDDRTMDMKSVPLMTTVTGIE